MLQSTHADLHICTVTSESRRLLARKPIHSFKPISNIVMTKFSFKWFILRASSVLTLVFLAVSWPLSLPAQETESTKEQATNATAATKTQLAEQALRAAINAEQQFDFKTAIEKLDEATKLGFRGAIAHYKRGCWTFRRGDIKASKKAFDRYVELAPQNANSQWERGITCYYAKAYKEGAQQFVDYQSYHDSDVENAVWRYLCQVKFDGKEKSRKAILPIRNDPRIPMMEIYRLFRGESHPQQVLDTLAKSRSKGLRAKHEKFDTHLYLALYFDSEGDLAKAKQHIDLSVKQFKQGDYMWAVAVEHQRDVDRQIVEQKRASASKVRD